MIGFCDMLYIAVFIQVVVIAYTPVITGCDIFQSINRSAPVFRSQGINSISVVIGITAFFDLNQQIIKVFLCVDCCGINPKIICNCFLNIHTSYIFFICIIFQRTVNFIDTHLPQIYTIQVITEYNVVLCIVRQIIVFIIFGIYFAVFHVFRYICEHSVFCCFVQQRELRSCGVIQVRYDNIRDGSGSQLRSQNFCITVTRCIFYIQFDTGQFCDLFHGFGVVKIFWKRISDIIYVCLYGDGPVSDPGIRFVRVIFTGIFCFCTAVFAIR